MAATDVKLRADHLESDRETGVSTAIGDVRMESGGAVITTDRLNYNQNTHTVYTDAPFTLVQQEPGSTKIQTITGTGLSYDMDADRAIIYDAKLTVPAQSAGQYVYITCKKLMSFHKGEEFEIGEGTFTTCDFVDKLETPHYHVQSGWFKYVPGEYVMANNGVTLYLNNHPVAWVPYFWLPLQKRDSWATFGKNNIEGLFIKTLLPYRLNDSNDGWMFLWGLEFKQPGAFGFDHVWRNGTTSRTDLTAFGLALPDTMDYVPGAATDAYPAGDPYALTNPWIVNRLDPGNQHVFQDHLFKIRHQQRLFGSMTLDGSYEDRNLYDPARVGSAFNREDIQKSTNPRSINYRDDHTAYSLAMSDSRLGINYGATHNFREDFGNVHTQNTTDHANVGGRLGSTDFSASTDRSQQAVGLPLVVTLAPGVVPSPAPSPDFNSSWNNSLSLTQTIDPTMRITSSTAHTRTDPPKAQIAARSDRLTQTLDTTKTLGWADLHLVATEMFNLAIPATASYAEQLLGQTSLGYVDKLPELTLNIHPIFEAYQPLTFGAVYGRYREAASYQPTVAPTDPNPAHHYDWVTRLKYNADLAGKPLDLGLGASLNFGSTGYEQRFYSTGDSEYRMTGQVALSNSITQFVNTNVTYRRDYTPPTAEQVQQGQIGPLQTFPLAFLGFNRSLLGNGNNASPFKQFESLALSRQNNINGSANVVVGEPFLWNNTLGYNYETARYTPYNTGITFRPNRRANITLGTGYTFAEKPFMEFGTGKWSDINSTVHLQSSDDAFGGIYGRETMTPGWSFDSTLVWSVDTGEWRSLSNTVVLETGTSWRDHWALAATGQYDVTTKQYEVLTVGINKDLHDFILSLTYNKRLQAYTVNLALVAFPTNLVNLSNKSFGNLGNPADLGAQFGLSGSMLTGGTP